MPKHLIKKSILENIILLLIKTGYYFFYDLRNLSFFPKVKNKIVFYTESNNQKQALIPLIKLMSKPYVFLAEKREPGIVPYPRFLPSLLSILLLPIYLLFFLIKSNQKDNEALKVAGTDVMNTFGFYYYYKILFVIQKPKAIIVANDHLYPQRVLTTLAKKKNVPSIYLQHASITTKFPPLDFDLALLEGQVAKKTYLKIGESPTQISLIGMIKFDEYYKYIKTNASIKTIGFAMNLLDDFNNYRKIIDELYETKELDSVIIRAHPSIYSNRYKKRLKEFERVFQKSNFIRISNPNNQNSFEYLQELDVIVAGNSGIHLEAILLNIPSVFFVNKICKDSYGFVESGMISTVNSGSEIINTIRYLSKKKNLKIRFKAKPFVDTIDTIDDGKSNIKAKVILERFINHYYGT